MAVSLERVGAGRVPAVIGVVAGDGLLEHVTVDVATLIGEPATAVVGRRFWDRVQPDDAATLLATLSLPADPPRGRTVVVRLRHADGSWRAVRLTVSPLDDTVPPSFAFVAADVAPPHRHGSADRLTALEGHLRRIAAELQASGILGDRRATAGHDLPALRGLTARQLDILDRIASGQRVPSIARDLIVSQSTVRNHLAAIYARLGVHSQVELLDLLAGRGHRRVGSPA